MKHTLFSLMAAALVLTGCGVKVFISDTRLQGPVPSPEEIAAATATAEALVGEATPTPSAAEADTIDAIIQELTSRVGEDFQIVAPFNGRETPNSGPLRGMRVEPGDQVRISSGRSQQTAVEAAEYCVEQRCSRVWVHARPKGGSLGAWYPVVVLEYELTQ
jgi:hypothetical protein